MTEERTPAPEPGIYYDIPDPEYRAWPYPSQSDLSLFRDPDLCELEIQHKLNTPSESNDAMRLGTDVETCLNGDVVGGKVQCLPPEMKVRRGKAWDAWKEGHPGIDWVPMSEYKTHGEYITKVNAIAENVRDNALAMKLIDGAKQQVSFVWDAKFMSVGAEEVTHRVKGRLDYLKPGIISDLKTTSFGGQRRVGSWAWSHAWDVQAAMYTDAITALTGEGHRFYFVAVRTCEPYVVTIYDGHNTTEAAGMFLQIGRASYQIWLERLAECRRDGDWRGYYDPSNDESRVLDFYVPSWAC